MSYAFMLDEAPTSPNYGKEVFTPVTILDSPPMTVCAIRAYGWSQKGFQVLSETWTSATPKEIMRLTVPPPKPETEKALSKLESRLSGISKIRVLACTNPRRSDARVKKPSLMEIAVGGKTAKEQLDYAKSLLGKEIDGSKIFSEGQFVDAISVSRGKGLTGPVRRFGIRILQNKSRGTKRGVGSIGGWHPAMVMSTVARAGQLGFSQRVEFNKQILKIGNNGAEITPKSGFYRYGLVRGSYIVVRGTLPGPPQRLVRLRYAVRSTQKIQLPKVTLYAS